MMKIKVVGVMAIWGVLVTSNVMAADHKHSQHVTPNKQVVTKQIVTKKIVPKQVVTKQVVTKKIVPKQVVTKQVVTKKIVTKQPSKKVADNQHNKNVTVIVRR